MRSVVKFYLLLAFRPKPPCIAAGTGTNGGLMVLIAVFLVIGAHVSCNFRFDTNRRSGRAGTGGTRSRTISARFCPNIRRDTATSATWKVT